MFLGHTIIRRGRVHSSDYIVCNIAVTRGLNTDTGCKAVME